jgi:hypothetical protein
MKNLRILPLILLLLLLFRCDLIDRIKGLEEIDFDIELFKTVPVDVDEDDPLTISKTFTIDAKSNDDVKEYLDKITEYDVWNIFVNFSEYVGEKGIVFEVVFKIGPFTADFTGMNAIVPSDNADTGGIIYLDMNQAALDAINAALLAGHTLECSMNGTVSDKPVSFIVNIYIQGTVYAEI